MITIDGEDGYASYISTKFTGMLVISNIFMEISKPTSVEIFKAKDIINTLREALFDMVTRPSYYKDYDYAAGYAYEDLLPILAKLYEACLANPDGLFESTLTQ